MEFTSVPKMIVYGDVHCGRATLFPSENNFCVTNVYHLAVENGNEDKSWHLMLDMHFFEDLSRIKINEKSVSPLPSEQKTNECEYFILPDKAEELMVKIED